MKRSNHTMLEGPLLGSIISYTIPVILTSILQLLFNAADLMIVGRFCGSVSVAAVGATHSLTSLMVNFFVGLSIGAGVTLAHGLGSRSNTVVHNTVHTALPISLICGAILTVIGVCFSGTFLRLMGTPADVLPLSTLYMQIYFGGITFTMIYNFCAAILRAAGDTRSPLLYLTFAGIINVALNVVFVTIFHMNVAGVALATTISQGISATLVVWALVKRTDACHLDLKKMRFYPIQLVKIMTIGLPAGLQSSLFSISNVLIQSSINSFGNVVMSGNAAAYNIEGFVYASLNSFQQTAVNFIGQNAGAQKYKRVAKIFGICMVLVTITGLILGALGYAFGPTLLSLYITDSQEAIACGMTRLSRVCLLYFICGMMDVCTGALRGLGKSLTPMVIFILGVCGVRVGWTLLVFPIPAFHSPQSLYISYPVSWALTFLLQFIACILVYRKHTKLLKT